MNQLFQNDDIHDIDYVVFQDPWRNTWDKTTLHPQKNAFHLIYFKNNKIRVSFFINEKTE